MVGYCYPSEMKYRSWVYSVLLVLFAFATLAQNAPTTFKNPVISGFHPDPSIVRVDDDYYLVNSSFEWFPGIPIFHSKDLVNWQQIGYVLDRPSQLNMATTRHSAGIWAPTIRYKDGKFYVSVTCKQCENDCQCGDNFYVTAEDPSGPWSDPVWIDGSEQSIDPTLYFEEDKVYYLGNRHHLKDEKWKSEHRIFIQEMDLPSGKLLGEPVYLTSGHAVNARAAEGPHLYKIESRYLLMISEGGTWNNHAITTFLSDNITGPYEATQVNPVLTHRHLGRNYPITTIGHADLVQDQQGEWWSVMLGVRPQDGFNILGRETFLTPVQFVGTQPIFNSGKGKVLLIDKRPALPWSPVVKVGGKDQFEGDRLGMEWNFLRTPKTKWHNLKKNKLILKLRPEKVTDKVNPSLIARRVEHYSHRVSTQMSFVPENNREEAGIILMQKGNYHYRLVVTKNNGQNELKLIKAYHPDRKVLSQSTVASVVTTGNDIVLGYDQNRLNIQFYYGTDPADLKPLGGLQDGRVISSNFAGGFTGPFTGLYASSNGTNSSNVAQFEFFEYRPMENEVFEMKEGRLIVEAERYWRQEKNNKRHWTMISAFNEENTSHAASAGGGSYLKILPDTRRSHSDKLIRNTNFSNKPGEVGILHYKVKIKKPGKYYVWARAYSSGSEDNSVHVGLDGTWPASGQRMQWCEGKGEWTWESKQRTKENHCGEPQKIFLQVNEPGEHIISFSMREDGFEFDQWALTKDYIKPDQ